MLYLPQEKDQDLKEIYKVIKEQVQESSERKESVLMVGDFNCRVGNVIPGNHHKVSKGGKKLLKTMEKEGLKMGNSMEKIFSPFCSKLQS